MKKIRIYNFVMLSILLSLVALPMMIEKRAEWLLISSMIAIILGSAFYAERTLTLKIMQEMDDLKWVNDTGLGPLYKLVNGMSGLTVLWVILGMTQGLEDVNLFPAAYMAFFLPFLLSCQSVYIGKNWIYFQNSYIKREAITSFEKTVQKQGKHRQYTTFKIHVAQKTYTIRLNEMMQSGIEALTHALTTEEKL